MKFEYTCCSSKLVYLLHVEKYKTTVQKTKPKIIAPKWNNDFQLLDGSYSVSDIQDYIEYIIKNHEALPTNPPIHIYISRISKRLVFKMKNEYKLELQTSETIKLFGDTKILIDKTKNGENVQSLEVAELVSVQ